MSSRPRGAPLADGLAVVVETAFRGALAATRPFSSDLPRLAPEGGGRVLVVAPHPDDEVAGCAGALLAHREAGDGIRVVVVTDGGSSRALGVGERATAARRRGEAEAAAGLLGASLEWLGFAEHGRDGRELPAALGRALADFAPDVVYAPSRIDYHPVHLRVAAALASGLEGLRVRVRVYQVHVPLARPLVNLVADVSAHEAEVAALLRSHRSQRESLERTLRIRRYAAARHGASRLAEEFLELSPEGYRSVHAASPPPSAPAFRGVRYRPFTDPLCWWIGRGARRSFARAVGGRS